jgi:eukaryotic-like serine/threonine-protein kinase
MLNDGMPQGDDRMPSVATHSTSAPRPAVRESEGAQPSDARDFETDFAPSFPVLLEGSSDASAPADGTTRRQRRNPKTGETIPQVPGYEILAEIGRGGMGVVYLARSLSLKRQVALKMILAGSDGDRSLRIRFRTEAEAVARLQHANIVHIYEVGECGGRSFLSLEYVEGGCLTRKFSALLPTNREAAQLVQAIASAVHYMHERGIVHRDLKPCNVLLTAEGTPKIADFGLAKIKGDEPGVTRTKSWFGTPSYMAPEQASGETRLVGPSADVYSLGAILYELLTGRPPFEGQSSLAILEQVRNQPPVPPRRLRRFVPLDLETICLKCLEKEPARRYASARDLVRDLTSFLEGRTIEARSTPLWQRLGRLARRHPAVSGWGLAAVATVTLTLTAWSYFQASGQLELHRAEANYHRFVERRNEALLCGLLAPEEGSLFLGADAAGNLKSAEAAARQALALAGVRLDSASPVLSAAFPVNEQPRVAADCCSLLLLLASVRAQHSLPGEPETGRYQAALEILDRSRQLGITTRAYYLRRASFLEQLGNHVAAQEARREAAAQPANRAEDWFLVGEEQYRHGEWKQATNSFDHALAQEPSHFWAQFFLAVCHLKMRQWEAAKAGLNACLTQQPDFVWAYVFRSFAQEKLHEYSDAEADFQRALGLNPNDDVRYVVFLTRGILHFDRGELDAAAENFRAAKALKPVQYNAFLNLAQVDLAKGRFDQAQETVGAAIDRRAPRQAVASYYLERGRKLLSAARYRESIAACDAAGELGDDDSVPQEIRARALLALGRYQQAETSFTRFLTAGGAQTSDVFRGRGLSRMKLGNFPGAVEDYTRALELAPDADVYQHRGWAHFFSDAWKLALRDFSKAIEFDSGALDAYVGRGLARVMLGDYRNAVADAEFSIRRNVETPEMMHNIGCIFAQAAARTEADRDSQDHQLLAAGYRSRALHAVRETLARLRPQDRSSFWRDKILPDSALAPIRDDVNFKRLGDRYSHL